METSIKAIGQMIKNAIRVSIHLVLTKYIREISIITNAISKEFTPILTAIDMKENG